MNLIRSETLAQGWLDACHYLLSLSDWTDTTLILNIETPTLVRQSDRAISGTLDAYLVDHDKFSNHTVAETIFPGYEYTHRGVEGVYTNYPEEIYPRIKDHPEMRRWGAYAYRLLRRTGADGVTFNPLQDCIAKMKDKNPKRAAYEIGLGFGFDLATYDDDEDRGARLGGPCLSHLSFKVIHSRVHLTALYRSHYYIQRAYGNLLGLTRLQAFVADQLAVPCGPLVCHSTMAVLEHGKQWGWRKSEVEPLIAACTLAANACSAQRAAS